MFTLDPFRTVVTVTGASGFIALHCVHELLERGYCVRGTVRDLAREPAIRKALGEVGASERLSFVHADLLRDEGWDEAMAGATYALHVASPVPARVPKNEDELVKPARDGTLRVLAAAHRARVARVVMTSSVSAIFAGHRGDKDRVFNEKDWSRLDEPLSAYDKSKTLAERAAWDYVRSLPAEKPLELVCLNPGYVLGPSLLGVDNTSNELVSKLLRREIPGVGRLHLAVVDVRDVATAHVNAMITQKAAGQRFVLVSETVWMKELAEVLAHAGYRVPTRQLPDLIVKLVALFDPAVRLVVEILGQSFFTSSKQARKVLGWSGRPMKDTVLDTAASIVNRK